MHAENMRAIIRNNRMLRREANYYRNKKAYSKAEYKLQIYYKKASPAEMRLLRAQIKKDKRKQRIIDFLLWSIAIALVVYVAFWLSSDSLKLENPNP